MDLGALAIAEPEVDEKKEKELLNSTIEKWRLIKTGVNPLDVIGNKKVRYNPNYNARGVWEVYLIAKLNYQDNKNPKTQAISSSYDSIREVEEALVDIYDQYPGATNIGVVIQDKRRNDFYAGYLNPIAIPEMSGALAG